jgi:hypothetical protein
MMRRVGFVTVKKAAEFLGGSLDAVRSALTRRSPSIEIQLAATPVY